MKIKFIRILILTLIFTVSGGIFVSAIGISAASKKQNSVETVRNAIDRVIDFNIDKDQVSDTGEWIKNVLAGKTGGAAEWYVIALSQYTGFRDYGKNIKKSLKSYGDSLEKYTDQNIEKNATARLKYSLTLAAVGSDASYIEKCLSDGTVDGLGIMSLVFGQHLVNNGYEYVDASMSGDSERNDRFASRKILIEKILEKQHADGGWSVIGEYGDIDVTAMTLQALGPAEENIYDTDLKKKCSNAVSKGITFLSERQLDDGAYSSFGTENAESTAQVLTCLSTLGIDSANDKRFIKNGNSVLDGLYIFLKEDGSFSHKPGEEYNPTATVQAFYSLVAYVRYASGKTPLYVLDSCSGKRAEAKEADREAKDNTVEKAEDNNENKTEDNSGDKNENNTADNIKEETGEDNEEKNEENSDVNSGENTEADKEGNAGNISEENSEEKNSEEISVNNSDNNTGEKDNSRENNKDKTGYKPYAIAGIVVLALIAFGVLAIKKKHKKNYLFVTLLMAAGILIVIFTDFKSAESYYSENVPAKVETVGTVTMSIRCDILNGKAESEYIPGDGCILDEKEFTLAEGETVYDLIIEAARKYGISVDHKGGSEIVYISGINYLYELDYGDLSGWVYKVNGELPSVGCAGYKLKDGDVIEWCYTLDLGNDCL